MNGAAAPSPRSIAQRCSLAPRVLAAVGLATLSCGCFARTMSALLVRLVFWTWLGAAIFVGQSGMLRQLRFPGMQAIVLGLTAILLFLYFRAAPIRRWADGLELRSLVLLHLTRFVGIYFLVLHHRGELPRQFAVPAGIGDIVVATMVLPVAFAPLDPRTRLRAITIWNVVGLVDMLLVIATITRINLADPLQLRAFMQLPLSLLPTFLVPLILASHLIIYVRVAREQAAFAGGEPPVVR